MAIHESLSLIAFTGPEGSGKSTQAKILAKSLKFPCVSTGDILRQAADEDMSDLGDLCRQILQDHVYLPPEKMLEVIKRRLQNLDIVKGVVLDGGLRTVEETKYFSEMLSQTGKDFSLRVLYLRVPGWICAERLMSEGGRNRVDDTPEAWLKRMNEFNTGLGVRMSIIRNHWSLDIINGNQSIPKVFEDICARL